MCDNFPINISSIKLKLIMKAWSGALLLSCLWMAAQNSEAKKCPCGAFGGNARQGRIIGGKRAPDHKYPWVVRMIFDADSYQFCDASILTEKVAVTNALCTNDHAKDKPISIVAGSADVAHPGQIVKVERYVSHEGYNYPEGQATKMVNDIALLFLAKPLTFNNQVSPICLPIANTNYENKGAKIIGWGALIPNSKVKSQYAMEIDVQVKPSSFCKAEVALEPSQKFICTLGSGTTVSRGDSGSPVAYLDPEINKYTLIGMVSFADSSNTSVPVFSTDVASYVPWIQTKINSAGCQKV